MARHSTAIAALFAASLLVSASGVSAAVIDFTSASTGTSGSVGGVSWTMTGVPVQGNNTQLYDGAGEPANSFGLAFDTDGYGIVDDEIGLRESITITFARAVSVTAFAFLDLFESLITPGSGEAGEATINGFTYVQPFAGLPGGYAEKFIGPVTTSVVRFNVGAFNDDKGVLDGALAALSVEVAPIPVPAAGLMLLTALGGVAALRRRKSV